MATVVISYKPRKCCWNGWMDINLSLLYFSCFAILHMGQMPQLNYCQCRLIICHKFLWIHTHPFNGPFSGTTQVSRYQKGKTNLDFTEARDGEWQWNQLLGHMQVCTLLQTDNHTSIPPLYFLHAGCPSCRPANSVKALKVLTHFTTRCTTCHTTGCMTGCNV